MNEKEVRLLFDAGHWESAQVAKVSDDSGWQVYLRPKNNKLLVQTLASKRGGPRVFKTSDTAILWCKDVGFSQIYITMIDTIVDASDDSENGVFAKVMDTVLLVEDNNDDIELTLHAFNKHGMKDQVVVTTDGEEALDYLFARGQFASRDKKEIPRLILLDINLPKISGLDVLKEIRENELTQFIPVVLLTTSEEHNDVLQGYKLGSNSYIKKPESFNVFEDVVSNLTSYWLNINTPVPTHNYQ